MSQGEGETAAPEPAYPHGTSGTVLRGDTIGADPERTVASGPRGARRRTVGSSLDLTPIRR
ncbi:hypothetical protein GCM10023084_28640 [Streptomyces lacrimifluminis]|uniref:Uncharacterized protein n=1 Tax=Streptomyces lacrimifluminis TaxID=1500077 RepID=A0A917NTW0_9ACTN|nr:hypothetical protein GCM10012282_25260 [Streptomyces lacrimifluminis]